MNKLTCIFFILLSCSLSAIAQNKSITDDLNTTKAGQGKVVIYQDDGIKKMVGSKVRNSAQTSGTTDVESQLSVVSDNNSTKTFVKAKGYRIQVYSGSDQKRSKNEAQYRKDAVQSAYPNMDATISYASPVWRVRVGNFKTHEQAQQALSEMKDKLPSFGREMRIVEDVIKVAVD